jgi:hypothetical protein
MTGYKAGQKVHLCINSKRKDNSDMNIEIVIFSSCFLTVPELHHVWCHTKAEDEEIKILFQNLKSIPPLLYRNVLSICLLCVVD